MENQEIYQINGEAKTYQIIHQDKHVEKPLNGIEIFGNINSVARYLEKNQEQFKTQSDDYFIQVSRDGRFISLQFNQRNPYEGGKSEVTGRLDLSREMAEWKINTGQPWDHKTLSEFIKMRRSYFSDRATAMKLSSELANIKIKTAKEFEKSDNNRGDFKSVLAQKVIQSNIPNGFTLNIPVFKGFPKVSINVELYVNPDTFNVTLVSPEAEDFIAEKADEIITESVDIIAEIAPTIPIIEV